VEQLAEGAGWATPQRSSTEVGLPHALVACALVSRMGWPTTLCGSRTMISAHFGFVASAAGVRGTVGAHAVTSPRSSGASSPAAMAACFRVLDITGIPFRLPFGA
jgi:hypothetical protein